MGYYPIVLEMAGRPVVVVGGGTVAERKVQQLLDVGARVTVLSPVVTARLESWARGGRVRHVARAYRDGDLLGYELAFVATGDREVNAAVAREARVRGVWINTADDPAHCDFILPSILRRGDLVVAVTTGGASPALARAIREELEAYFADDYAALLQIAAEVRRDLRARVHSPSAEVWRAALDARLRRQNAEGKRAEARTY
ncbi:MAG: bifunctional precorrin-2 dehydrogenase/sirohydrochlorin ferrochelatase, partial [Elusimicrobia bacterium]|nr:bifunctional precorrin-2 dehydrogenase/sirohydrochlorin ferrochelatase [Elusimicrobiota bacterium]